MRRKTVLALIAAMTVAVSGNVYAGEQTENTDQKSGAAEENAQERSAETGSCETGEHQWSEWKITIPADCVTQGQQTRKCEVCGAEETASIAKTEEHDLKEISRQEATEEKEGFILYACKRNGCEYQKKEEIPVKETTDSEHASQEEESEKENTSEPMEETENTDGTEKESPETDTQKEETEALPDEDAEEGTASFAYATSSEVVAEYDPTTAVSTRRIVRDPSDPASAEEVEGMTVPEGSVKVQRDSEGNVTDLSVSASVKEIRNGFSFSSENKTLHSISILNEKDSSKNWITLSAEKTASELGIRMKQTKDGTTVTLTENKKPVRIVKVMEDEKKITLLTSTGGSFMISKHIQNFKVKGEYKNPKDINEICFSDMSSQKPYVELRSLKEENVQKNKKEKAEEEKSYWLQQYDDETQDSIVITVYGK